MQDKELRKQSHYSFHESVFYLKHFIWHERQVHSEFKKKHSLFYINRD